jgi:hypothetical protein
MSIYVSSLYTGTLLAPLVGAYIYGGMGVHSVFVSCRQRTNAFMVRPYSSSSPRTLPPASFSSSFAFRR